MTGNFSTEGREKKGLSDNNNKCGIQPVVIARNLICLEGRPDFALNSAPEIKDEIRIYFDSAHPLSLVF